MIKINEPPIIKPETFYFYINTNIYILQIITKIFTNDQTTFMYCDKLKIIL